MANYTVQDGQSTSLNKLPDIVDSSRSLRLISGSWAWCLLVYYLVLTVIEMLISSGFTPGIVAFTTTSPSV